MKPMRHYLLTALLLAGLGSSSMSFAQHDDFNVRTISDHIFAQHLYRDKLLRDRYRPTYHFVIPEGMAHPYDPNGAFYWKGRYHLFYIFQPQRPQPFYRGDAWAHVSSHNLLHWCFHPTALKPDDASPERAIYSGNMFVDKDGVPTIMYQGLGAGNSIARSTGDRLLEYWKKHDGNPVIPYPEFALDHDGAEYRVILDRMPDYGEFDVWDPHCWLEGDTYYAISGNNSIWPGRAAIYRSKNLEDWDLLGDFFHHDGVENTLDCPDFFELDGKHVLLYLRNGLEYIIGEFRDEQFHPEKKGTMTWNCGVGYAPESLVDDKGRRIMWAALNDSRTGWGELDEFIVKHGWCGTLTLPRVLSLDANNELLVRPIEELQELRHSPVHREGLTIDSSEMVIGGVEGNELELIFTVDPGDAKEFGVRVCKSADGEEQTTVSYNAEDKKIRVDLSRTSLDEELMSGYYSANGLLQEADLPLAEGEMVEFHIFIDRSVLEIFVNGRLCLTHRVYPTLESSDGVAIYSRGGSIHVPEFKSWRMHPSNPF